MNWVKHPKYNLEVSSSGLVRGSRGNLRKPRKDRYGYLRLNIQFELKHKTVLIHRLVADCFQVVGEGLTIDHIDGNKENNNVYNLQKVTAGENAALCFKRGLHSRQHSVTIGGIQYVSKREAERETGIDRHKL